MEEPHFFPILSFAGEKTWFFATCVSLSLHCCSTEIDFNENKSAYQSNARHPGGKVISEQLQDMISETLRR